MKTRELQKVTIYQLFSELEKNSEVRSKLIFQTSNFQSRPLIGKKIQLEQYSAGVQQEQHSKIQI